MAPSSSSTKKAAKLAKSRQGKAVRFQGGTLFPVVVTIVVVLGSLLVLYARQSRPSVEASGPPLQSDQWTHSYGFYLCDTWFRLEGDAEEPESPEYVGYARTGVHSHDDGLIHWHAFSSDAVGSNARLGVFLDTYDVQLTNSKLTFPETQRSALDEQLAAQGRENPLVWEAGETTCDVGGSEKDASLKVVVWKRFSDTNKGTTYIADFKNIRLDRDQMVLAIAFVPDDTDVIKPPWTPELPSLGDDADTVAPADSIPSESTPVDSTTADTGSVVSTEVPATTEG